MGGLTQGYKETNSKNTTLFMHLLKIMKNKKEKCMKINYNYRL